jgi:GNAT superfamily N-acetyltransferase
LAGAGGLLTVDYRDATPDDADALSAMFRDSFTETFGHLYDSRDLAAFLAGHSADRFREQLGDPDYAVRVAEQDRVLAGFAKAGPLKTPADTDRPAFELQQFYVRTAWHGTGVAAELMNWFLIEARRRGAEEAYLSVFTRNQRARRFYSRFGFTDFGPAVFMVGNQADEDVIMRLAL